MSLACLGKTGAFARVADEFELQQRGAITVSKTVSSLMCVCVCVHSHLNSHRLQEVNTREPKQPLQGKARRRRRGVRRGDEAQQIDATAYSTGVGDTH